MIKLARISFVLLAANWSSHADWSRINRPENVLATLGNRVFAGGLYPNGPIFTLYLSRNDGIVWDSVATAGIVGGLAVLGGKVYHGISSGNGIYVSSDSGETFAPMGSNAPFSIASFTSSGADIFAGGNSVVYRWNAAGNIWDTLGGVFPPQNSVRQLLVADSLLYAILSRDGLYVLRLGTQSWRRLSPLAPPHLALRYPMLYAAAGLAGVIRMPVGDSIWDTVRTGIPSGRRIERLAVSDTVLFATGRFAGVYRSVDGMSWLTTNEGLVPDSTTPTLVAGDRYLFLTTYNNLNSMVLRRPLSDFDPVGLRSGLPKSRIPSQVRPYSLDILGRQRRPSGDFPQAVRF